MLERVTAATAGLLEYTCSGTLWEEYLGERGLTLPDVAALPSAAR